jgi:hypothetical protein
MNRDRIVDEQRFDNLARQLRHGMPRRPLIAAMAMTVLATLQRPQSALACKKVGRKCDKNKDCCDGARCKGGKKGKCRCKSGFTKCNKKRFDLDKDEKHCGSCNTVCAPGATCQDGICACARNDDAFACGTSGVVCGPPCAENEACVDGACVSCAEACDDESCTRCFRLADGATICGSGSTANCPEPCMSADDCGAGPFNLCVVSVTLKSNGSASPVGQGCTPPATTGLCTSVTSCSST